MKVNEVKAKLVEVGIRGAVVDANNPGIKITFTSTREDLTSRSFKLISDITGLINTNKSGQDYKEKQTYAKRYQPFIDAGTTEFQVELTSIFNVQK
jgi:hypothetical protein